MTEKPQLILSGSGKSGKKQRAPVDHAATLFSRATAQLIDLLCEGEVNGLVDGSKSIFFDEVRVQNDDGSFNFEGVTVQEKVGTPSQAAVKGFDEVESTVSISQEVTDISSPTFTITETSIDAIRVIIQIPSLMIQNVKNGDLLPHTVGLKIEVTENHAGGAFTEILSNEITGKTKSAYQRSYRIDLSPYTTDAPSDYPLIFKVSRTTPEATETTTQDQIFVDSYIEIQEQKFEYPDSAYVAITVDSELFGGRIPKRSYEIEGLKIQHPANYDPVTRLYTGIWDGTFLEGYCNNPAWVMYDMLTNSRYGLGDDIDTTQVDKTVLYQIGQYCDELVDDGKGGLEPRFTLNAVITQRKDAYTVINAIASVFRGMAFWSAGGVSFSNDQPKDAVRVVTNASVKDGDFTYSGVGLKARHSAVLVTWNDPLDFFKQQIEVIEDAALIQRFGWRQIELVAFGTTSRAQAIRMGKWLLQAEASETETVTYEAGWDHADTTPGQIIKISDEHRVGVRISGRILAKSLHSLTAAIPTDAIVKETTFSSVTTYVDTGVESDADAVFKCSIKIPSAIVPEGLIFEAGDSTTGAYVGFDSAGSLIFRAGDASGTPDVATSAKISIPYASLPKDQDLDILWDYRVSPGRIRVWINNAYVAEQGTSAGADFLGSAWASTGGGGYGKVSGTTVLGEAGNFTQNVQLSGVLLQSTLEYWRATDVFTPTQPHTIKESFSATDAITSVTDATAGGMDRNTNAVVSCAIKTPAAGTVPVGIIVELGEGTADANEAFYLGFDGTGDLVAHAGAGGDSPDTAEAARIVVPASEWDADTWYHLTVNILPATGEIGLWINHTFREFAQTSDLGPFQNGQWADADSGGYAKDGTTLSTLDLTGNFALAFNGTITSSLDYYRDVELIESQNAFDAGTLTLDQDWTAEPGDSIVVVVADNAPNAIPLVPGTAGAAVTLRGRTRKDVALNAVFFIQGAVSAQEWTVLNNREADTHQYQITALRFDRTKFDRVEQGIVIEPERVSLLPTGTVLPPTNLRFDESLYVTTGNVHTRINLSWSPAKDPRAMLYLVEAETPGASRHQIALTAVPNITIQPAEEGLHSFWVSSTSDAMGATHVTSTAELLNQTVVGRTAAPENVANFTAVRGFITVTLHWDQVVDLDLRGYTIKQGGDWGSGTEVVSLFVGNKYIVDVDDTSDITFMIKAIDTTGNESELATALVTSIQILGTVSSLISYQRQHNIRVTWTALVGITNVMYEIRHGATNWETSRLLNRVATPYLESPFSVAAETVSTIRIKPYVALSSGDRHYGPETTISHTQHSVIEGFRVKSRAEHTAWTELDATLLGNFLVSGPDPNETIVAGGGINPQAWYMGPPYGGPPRVGTRRPGAFICNMTVDGTPEGTIAETGSQYNGGMMICFDGAGDLVARCGSGYPYLDKLASMTSVISRWILNEPSGNRLDEVGTNDLTVNGTVVEGYGPIDRGTLFDGTAGSYLSGTDVTINTKSWSLCFRVNFPSEGFSGSGKVLQLGTGSTLVAEFIAGYMTITVQDSGGAFSVTGTEDYTGYLSYYSFIITFDDSSKLLSLYARFDVLEDSDTAASSLVDAGSGELRIGESFLGSVNDVWWIERIITAGEITDFSTNMLLSAGTARVVIPFASIPQATAFNLGWDMAVGTHSLYDPGEIRVWIDGASYSAETAHGEDLWGGPSWSSNSSSGDYGESAGVHPEGESGLFDQPLNADVTLNTDLFYWYDQLVYDPLEVSAGELTLVSGAHYGKYVLDFDFLGKRKGRMWVEYSAVSTSATELYIDDAQELIDTANDPITELFSEVDPQVSIEIQLDGTGDYVPFEEGTYEFTTAKFKLVLTRGESDTTKPLLENFTVFFHNDGDQTTLQAQTTDATQTTLTTDQEAASALNIITLTDDNTLRFEGTLMAKKSDGTEKAKYFISGLASRETGAASVTIDTSQVTNLFEDDENWAVDIVADTTNGGVAIKVTGVAGTTINWLADLYAREFG